MTWAVKVRKSVKKRQGEKGMGRTEGAQRWGEPAGGRSECPEDSPARTMEVGEGAEDTGSLGGGGR